MSEGVKYDVTFTVTGLWAREKADTLLWDLINNLALVGAYSFSIGDDTANIKVERVSEPENVVNNG